VQPAAAADGGPRLVLVDFGLVKRLPDDFRAALAATLLAMLRGRPLEILQELGRLGFRTRSDDVSDLVPLMTAMLEFAGKKPEEMLSETEIVDRFGREALRAYRDNPVVKIPQDVLLVMRVLGILGGVSRQLSTQVNLIELLKPFAREGAAPKISD
jgi:predicted unusual protein kinase regulating ubiquinone biosynthesis (AarF/ABC1/UbiB family)